MSDGVVLFHTTAMAMKAEKALVREGFTVSLIPTPRQLSSDCGIALRFSWTQSESVVAVLRQAGVEGQGIYLLTI